MVLSVVGGCYLGHFHPSPPHYSPLPFPRAHLPVSLPPHRFWSGRWKMETVTPRSRRGGGCDSILRGGALGTPTLGDPALNPPSFCHRALQGARECSELETQDL